MIIYYHTTNLTHEQSHPMRKTFELHHNTSEPEADANRYSSTLIHEFMRIEDTYTFTRLPLNQILHLAEQSYAKNTLQ